MIGEWNERNGKDNDGSSGNQGRNLGNGCENASNQVKNAEKLWQK